MMDLAEALAALEAAGTEQHRQINLRHGVTAPSYGVSATSLANLAKQIKVDHALALALWATGNHDARVLATKIADPARLTAKVADTWAKDCDNYLLVEAAASPVGRSEIAPSRAKDWRDRKGEWVASLGWAVTAHLALSDGIDEIEARGLLRQITREIHDRPNRVRHEMNGVVIAIGTGIPDCRQAALAAADDIGTIDVDHGETGCKTPDAYEYIERTVKHRAQTRTRRR